MENMKKLIKKVVIIGGSSGIGLASANLFIKKGYFVIVLSRDGIMLSKQEKNKFNFIKLNIKNINEIKDCVRHISKKWGKIDILINSAGIGRDKAFDKLEESDYYSVFETNVKGLIFSTKLFSKIMKKGSIIFQLSSIAGIKGFKDWSVYSASKFAVEGFSKSIREDLRDKKIKLTVLQLGSVDTPFYNYKKKSEKKDFIKTDTVANSILNIVQLNDKKAVVENIFINNFVGDL
jgi:NADP-dependent 3-hydroxy acid dehydrogenase YdfG